MGEAVCFGKQRCVVCACGQALDYIMHDVVGKAALDNGDSCVRRRCAISHAEQTGPCGVAGFFLPASLARCLIKSLTFPRYQSYGAARVGCGQLILIQQVLVSLSIMLRSSKLIFVGGGQLLFFKFSDMVELVFAHFSICGGDSRGSEILTLLVCIEVLAVANQETLEPWIKTMPVYRAWVSKSHSVFIPIGWVIAGKPAGNGSRFAYRKSWFFNTTACEIAYEQMVDFCQHGKGGNNHRMR